MNALMLLLVLLLQGPEALLTGVVLKSGTDEPVARATVELRAVEASDSRIRTVTTANDGRFTFRGVPRGQYRLTVTRLGYVGATYGERRPGGPGTPITLPDTSDVRVSLTPSSVITGRIFDRQGQPTGNATVRAYRLSFQQGRQSLAEVQSTYTNDLGEYRLFFLTPGKYYVGVTPGIRGVGGGGGTDPLNAFRAQRENTRTESVPTENIDIPIYFPGTPDQLVAAPIELKPGAEVRNIDIIAGPVRANHIRGVIVAAEPGQRLAETATMRLSSGTGTRFTGSPVPNFDVSRVLPGRYILSAVVGTLSGRVNVEVFDQDLKDITIPVSSPFDLSGRVIVEGASAENPGPDVKSLRVVLRSEPIDGTNITPPIPAADGSFTLPSVPAGTYRVSLSPPLQNGYVKSVQLGNSEGVHSGITVRGRSDGLLQIVVSAKPGLLQGRVLDGANQPLPNAMTVLVPEPDLRGRADLYRNVATTPSGEFKLQGLTPGNYMLFAWQEVENGAWLNSEFMREFESRGLPVVITEGGSERLEVRAISN
jgi:Carboxypeptidase regulatory-like domain